MDSPNAKPAIRIPAVLVAATVTVLALVTVHLQITGLRMTFLEGDQLNRHVAVLNGTALNPWQYRILSDYVIEAIAFIPRRLHIGDAVVLTFIAVRVAQNATVFGLAYVYFRRLSITPATAVLGLNLLALAMLQADVESDLAFSTYFDLIFYLLAALAVLSREWRAIVPLTFLAALNRETSALIPLLPLAAFAVEPRPLRLIKTSAAAALVFVLVYASIHYAYGPRALMLGWDHQRGIELFLFNMRRYGWVRMTAMFGTLPLLAVVGYSRWPRELKAFCWLILPVWFGVHAFTSVMTETRLFLVPLVVVILPGCLLIDARGSAVAPNAVSDCR
ncbi:MAG TPA: hypothetical protein VHZ73_13155 [Vicinamibacterales bacterium]|nr:hypothetical protein [Vicinamibacterales bacterium]